MHEQTDTSRRDPRPRRKGLRIVLAGAIILMLLGHISNVVSINACEEKAVRSFILQGSETKTLRLRSSDATSFFCNRLRLFRIDFELVSDEEFKADPFPTGDMLQAVPVCPFVVSIYCEFLSGPIAGSAGRAYLFTLFGRGWLIWHDEDWVS